MNNAGGHQYQSQATIGSQPQSFNPYHSYASSERTYYDPEHNSGSQPATWGQKSGFGESGPQYGMDTRPGAGVGQSREFSDNALPKLLLNLLNNVFRELFWTVETNICCW
jgi:hypothetical protein